MSAALPGLLPSLTAAIYGHHPPGMNGFGDFPQVMLAQIRKFESITH
jgi:hypothetical protein